MKNYQAPPAWVGMPGQYVEAPGAPPAAAFVTAIGERTVTLGVLHPGFSGWASLDGVRHESDPDKHAITSSGYGVWRYCPCDPASNAALERANSASQQLTTVQFDLMKLADAYKALEARLAAAEQGLGEVELLTATLATKKKT